MKSTYTAPKLTSLGNVAEITQVSGGGTRKDFVFFNGAIISDNDDFGSKDICGGTTPRGPKCDPRF
jgi:hypothetical protein